jgi:psp operon transcriptional activator
VELDWSNWPGFSPRAMAAFEAYHWPGNVRELRNVVERSVYRHEDPERPVDEIQFDPFHSPWAPTSTGSVSVSAAPAVVVADENPQTPSAVPAPATTDFRAAVADYERQLLEEALSRNRFNQRATAAALGLSYDQLRHALKRHRLQDAS